MNKYRIFILLVSLIAFTSSAMAQSGNLKGNVVDKSSGLALPGAKISIDKLQIGDVSDVYGNFSIVNIPAGDYSIIITYIGYSPLEQKVTIEDGKTLALNFKLEVSSVVSGEVVVIGEGLKGQARALNTQKNKINITNIVAADQIGRFPDANVGDALKRIPGITIQNDQGEARFGLVRGTAARLNSVTINGDRIPSAEAETRVIQLDLIPSDMIQQIEVNKVLTPDMDADAIGGSINLVTRAPQDERVSITLGSNYNFLTGDPALTGSFIAGDRFNDGKMGWIVSGSVFDHFLGSDNVEGEWTQDGDNVYMSEMDIRTYILRRVRRSVSAGFDYNINANHRIFLNGIYNWRDDWETRYRTRYRDIELNDDGTYTAEVRRQTKGGIDNNRVKNQRLEDQRTYNFGIGGEHLFGNILKANWRANYAEASENRPNERYISYRQKDVIFNGDFANTEEPLLTRASSNPFDANNFELREITEETQNTTDTDFNARIDFELPIMKNLNIKFGGRLRSKEKQRSNDFFEYAPTDEDFYDNMNNLPFGDQSKDDFLAGDKYDAGNYVDTEYLGGLDLDDASQFEKEDLLEEYAGGNFDATEDIIGGYAMATWKLNKLTVLGGLRFESTSLEYNANELIEDVNGDFTVNPRSETSDYTNILPNLQLKYDFTNKLNVRAAFTQSIARPDYFDLAPYQIVVEEDQELERGNPGLEPTVSTNLDLMTEYYFDGVGILSGGVFYKDIQDFIYTYNQDDFEYNGQAGWEFSERRNGAEASLFGFEVAFQRQLDFLPSFLKNLNLYLNYTYTNSETDGLAGREGETLSLPGTAGNMFNASLSYEDKDLIIRIASNYASDYIDELGDEAFEDRYYDEQLFVDFNASYRFYDSFRVFVEANNLTNQPLRYYQGEQDRVMQIEYYNSRVHLGFKWDM